MKTNNLGINQLSPEAFQWYLTYLRAVDEREIDAYASFLAEDCVMQTNSNPPMQGKKAIIAGLAQYWQSFAGLEHDLLNIYGTDTSFVLEAWNHYTRHDGTGVSLRAAAFTDRNSEGRVQSVRLYADVSPLFAPAR